jgi:hypothetical protein
MRRGGNTEYGYYSRREAQRLVLGWEADRKAQAFEQDMEHEMNWQLLDDR